MRAKRAFINYNEPEVKFPPTFKYDLGKSFFSYKKLLNLIPQVRRTLILVKNGECRRYVLHNI